MERNVIHNADSRKMKEIPDDGVALTIMKLSDTKGDDDDYFSMLCDVLKEVVRVTIPGGKVCMIHRDIMLHSRLADFLRTIDTYLYARIILHEMSDDEPPPEYFGFHAEYKTIEEHEHLHVYRKGKKSRPDKAAVDGRYITKNEWKNLVHGVWPADPNLPNLFLENCIKMYSFPRDIILDPLMKDGPTLVSAKKLGRYYVGYDRDLQRVKQAEEILSQTDFASNLTHAIKDRSPEIKKPSLLEITACEPEIESLKSAEKNSQLEHELKSLLTSKQDIIEECENSPAYLIDEFILWLQKDYFVENQSVMELAKNYPDINMIHLIIQLGGWGILRESDKIEIEKHFRDKGIEDVMAFSVYELKEFEKGRRLVTIKGWREKRLEKERAKEERRKVRKGLGEIKTLMGKNNILVIAPHGVFGDDDHTNVIAEELNKKFGCFAVINEKYRRPDKNKGESSDPDKFILDLNLIEDAKKVEGNEFLGNIDKYANMIVENSEKPLVFHIHGIKDRNITEVAKISKNSRYQKKPKDLHTLIGYGQNDEKLSPLTAEEKTVEALIKRLEGQGINAIRAPVENIYIKAVPRSYCGNSKERMNQYFAQKGIGVQSVQVEIRKKSLRNDPTKARETARLIGQTISSFILKKRKTSRIAPVQKKIKVAEIELKHKSDWKYIFRFMISAEDDTGLRSRLDAEIEGLANSIKHDGLAHPLVLIQKKDKKYRILCGYRRYKALRKLGLDEVEAVIYQEGDLTDEQAIRLSLAENTERRDLNDIEIGHFLNSFIENLGWTQEKLGREFGESLGFGISHSAVNKRLKLYKLWEKRESRDLMVAYLNGEVNFGLISEELISLDDEKDRDALYNSIVKPLKPTKAELHEIKNLLRENGGGYQSVLSRKEIKKVLNQAQSSNNHGSEELIKLLKIHKGDALTKQKIDFDQKADAIRKSLFGKDASGDDFSIIPPPDMEKDEFTVQFRLARDGLKDTMKKIKQFVNKEEFIDELFTIIDGNPGDV